MAAEGGAVLLLAEARFRELAEVPAELEWFANLDNPRTRRAYQGISRSLWPLSALRRPSSSAA